MSKFQAEEYDLPFFHEQGYVRKLCPKCNTYFWTLNPEQETCQEANKNGCATYSFLDNPPTKRGFSLREMRESFLSFFEKHDHARIKPYPVVARWRDDLYLTHASIIDFQPYVTDGLAPAPANPLVISQPCIRLVDVDNTGPTFGRHLTIFEMGGAHAFNYPDKEVYWKDQTVRYQNEWVTKDLGVKPDEITYKEEVWSGGGNAGPCVESIIRGLEVDTLVFMQYKVINGEFVKLPIRTVDTGYGMDRYAWISQGVVSGFHAIYGELLEKVLGMAGIEIDHEMLKKVATVSGLVSVDKASSRLETRKKEAQLVGVKPNELEKLMTPVENAFAVVDHAKCLSFILSEGVVPSNIQEGYLARLVFRRIYRLLRMLGISDRLHDIMDMEIGMWSTDFPQLWDMRNEIMEMVKIEELKFEETIKRGEGMVKRISEELRAKGKKEIPAETLTELYDSHGLPPEIVKQAAEKEQAEVKIPDNFYTLIAERHMQVSKEVEEKEAETEEWLKKEVQGLAPTETLYYEDQYQKQFEAKVLKVIKKEYVILDKTCFFPEGGGQPADSGHLNFKNGKADVVDVQKVGNVIVHRVKGSVPEENQAVKGQIDWNKRYSLMKSHTTTHVIGGAAKRVLGQHVWQFGTQKGTESSRLDISHYRRLSLEELHKIETLANNAVHRDIQIDISWMPRSEAENRYGFRLYQGGAVPGKEIRVVRAGDWDVEACAGTHLKSTGEIGFIKITHSERVQDGVERLEYSTGASAVKCVQENEGLLVRLSEIFNAPLEKLDQTAEKIVRELKEANAERRRLTRELATRDGSDVNAEVTAAAEELNGVKIVARDFRDSVDVDRMVQTASEIIKRDETTVTIFYGANDKNARIMVMAGKTALEKGVNAGKIVREASPLIGGGGGGRPGFAQGGGTQVTKLQEAVKKARETLKKQLKP